MCAMPTANKYNIIAKKPQRGTLSFTTRRHTRIHNEKTHTCTGEFICFLCDLLNYKKILYSKLSNKVYFYTRVHTNPKIRITLSVRPPYQKHNISSLYACAVLNGFAIRYVPLWTTRVLNILFIFHTQQTNWITSFIFMCFFFACDRPTQISELLFTLIVIYFIRATEEPFPFTKQTKKDNHRGVIFFFSSFVFKTKLS